jgi:hypothetical protein
MAALFGCNKIIWFWIGSHADYDRLLTGLALRSDAGPGGQNRSGLRFEPEGKEARVSLTVHSLSPLASPARSIPGRVTNLASAGRKVRDSTTELFPSRGLWVNTGESWERSRSACLQGSAELDRIAAQEGTSRSDVLRASLEDYFFVRRFRALRQRLMATAQAQGIFTDEDVFDRVS